MNKMSWGRAPYAGALLIIVAVTLFHVLSLSYVRSFYANNLPHYDSIGSYTVMFDLMATYHREGFLTAFTQASHHFLSWGQMFFAVLAAPFLSPTPESVQLYNTLALLVFSLSVYSAATAYGAGKIKAFLLSMMIFVPDVFSDWWGGMLDMRRDFAFIALLGSVFFMFFSCAWAPSRTKSALLGIILGLVVYSRDNAIFFIIAIMGPIFFAGLAIVIAQRKSRVLAEYWTAIPAFLLLGVPWLYANLGPTLARRLDPFVIYGTGESPWVSFMAHWAKPFQMMFGRLGKDPSNDGAWHSLTPLGDYLGAPAFVSELGRMGGGIHGTLLLTAGWMLIVAISIFLLRRFKAIDLKSPFEDRRLLQMSGAGLWALLTTYFILCYVVALEKLGYSETQIPFFPTLLFFFSLLFVFGVSIQAREKFKAGWIGIAAAGFYLSLMALSIYRFEAKAPEPTSKYVGTAQKISEVLQVPGKQANIAFFWHDTISYDTIAFYHAQQGRHGEITKFLYEFEGHWLDSAVTLPDGVSLDGLLRAMDDQVNSKADFVVVNTGPVAYDVEGHHAVLFANGKPVVDNVLSSKNFKPVLQYELWGEPFVVLEKIR